jgi:type IV secretion system protein VirB4
MQLRDRFTFTDKPADEYLPWYGHIADDVVLLEDGSHLTTIRIDGRPMSLMDDPARYAERRRRHAMLRALADTNVSLYEHQVCHDRVEPFRHGRFRSAYARQLAEDYHAGLDSGLRTREWFLTIIVRPSSLQGILNRLIGKPPKGDESLARQLEEKAASVLSMLREYHPVRLGIRMSGGVPFSEIGEAMRLVLYGRWHPVPLTTGPLAGAIYTDRVICGMRGFEVLSPGGSSFGLLFGLRDYPEIAKPAILDGLLAAMTRLVITNSFHYRSAAAASDRMALQQRRMMNAGDRAVSLAEGLDDAIDDLQSGRAIVGDHHWSLSVHAESMAQLDRAAGEIRAILANTSNLAAAPEAVGCFPAYWAQVPGAPAVVRARHGNVSGFNFCSFSSLCGFPSGSKRPHWGHAVLRLITQGNTAHDYDPHIRRVAQALLIGPPGYGKSLLIGLFDALLEQALVPKDGLSVILDKDGSNELSVLARGGYYVRILRGQGSGMAPLKALDDTAEARSWLAEFIRGLIMADGKGEPPADQVERIDTAIAFLLRRPPVLRWLGGLRMFLDHGDDSTGARLERWCRGGSLGWAFDGDEDLIRLDAGVVGIDNTQILRDDMETVRAPAAAYQFFRIREKIGRGIRGAVYVDEAPSYLPDARFAAGFDAFSRELRKGNGLLWLAVHHPQDVVRHPMGKALVGNCPTLLLFPNPSADEQVYREALHCSAGEIEAVVEGMLRMGEGTFLVKRPEGSFIARAPLHGHPEHIAILSSDPLRSALWHRIAGELGTTDPDRIWAEYRNRYQEASA